MWIHLKQSRSDEILETQDRAVNAGVKQETMRMWRLLSLALELRCQAGCRLNERGERKDLYEKVNCAALNPLWFPGSTDLEEAPPWPGYNVSTAFRNASTNFTAPCAADCMDHDR